GAGPRGPAGLGLLRRPRGQRPALTHREPARAYPPPRSAAIGSIAAALSAGYSPASRPITPPSRDAPITIRRSRIGVHSLATDTATTTPTPIAAPISPP